MEPGLLPTFWRMGAELICRKSAYVIAVFLVGMSVADAQKSQSDLHSEIETSLPSGRPDILTAEALRGVLHDMVTSASQYQSVGYPIANLPTCSTSNVGLRAHVTNGQAAPPFLGVVSTTGTTTAPVFCNGTAWVYGG